MNVTIKHLGLQTYQTTWDAMQTFTANRTPEDLDEIWVVEHPAVYTQGQAGKAEHIINPTQIPIVHSDRGGQVTYHGPGQLVIYLMLDLNRRHLGIRSLVTLLEQAVIDLLRDRNLNAVSRCDAPGVYVEDAKICSIGLRSRRGYSYHGLAFNVDMDLSPFNNINPCGFKGLKMTQLKHYDPHCNLAEVTTALIDHIVKQLA